MRIIETNINIQGMHCVSCAKIIRLALEKMPGVESAEVDFATQQAQVNHQPDISSVSSIKQAVHDLGYGAK